MQFLAYHGTNRNFKEFNLLKSIGTYSRLSFGIYFTLNKERAISYSKNCRLISANISFKNLFNEDDTKIIKVSKISFRHCDLIKHLKNIGYTQFGIYCFLKNYGFDGVKSKDTLIVFSNSQIKQNINY